MPNDDDYDRMVREFAECMGISPDDVDELLILSKEITNLLMRQSDPERVAAIVGASLHKTVGVLVRRRAN